MVAILDAMENTITDPQLLLINGMLLAVIMVSMAMIVIDRD